MKDIAPPLPNPQSKVETALLLSIPKYRISIFTNHYHKGAFSFLNSRLITRNANYSANTKSSFELSNQWHPALRIRILIKPIQTRNSYISIYVYKLMIDRRVRIKTTGQKEYMYKCGPQGGGGWKCTWYGRVRYTKYFLKRDCQNSGTVRSTMNKNFPQSDFSFRYFMYYCRGLNRLSNKTTETSTCRLSPILYLFKVCRR